MEFESQRNSRDVFFIAQPIVNFRRDFRRGIARFPTVWKDARLDFCE
jgi:hypothetical protein